MLKYVNITGPYAYLSLNMQKPDNGILITDITGIGSTKATINTSEYAMLDGQAYNSARAIGRNIVLTLKPVNGLSYEDMRNTLRTVAPVKSAVTIEIITDSRSVYTTGYVESNESSIFTADPVSVISIICESAYLTSNYEKDNNVIEFYGLKSTFEFPFSNPTNSKSLEFGKYNSTTTADFFYIGDVPTGITVEVDFFGTVGGFYIWDPNSDAYVAFTNLSQLQWITGSSNFESGDHLTISTVTGDKRATLYREGQEYDVITLLGYYPKWITLNTGLNRMSYYADTGTENIKISISYKTIYEGV